MRLALWVTPAYGGTALADAHPSSQAQYPCIDLPRFGGDFFACDGSYFTIIGAAKKLRYCTIEPLLRADWTSLAGC